MLSREDRGQIWSAKHQHHSQSDIENCVTRGRIHFPLTLPKDGKNQTFPIGVLKFRNINAEQHNRDWLVWS